MRKQVLEDGAINLWLSACDTYDQAHRPSAAWPYSFLSNKPLFTQFAPNGDLIDIAINYDRGDQNCPSNEFTAITNDFLHPNT